jgi:hypothetical protein
LFPQLLYFRKKSLEREEVVLQTVSLHEEGEKEKEEKKSEHRE